MFPPFLYFQGLKGFKGSQGYLGEEGISVSQWCFSAPLVLKRILVVHVQNSFCKSLLCSASRSFVALLSYDLLLDCLPTFHYDLNAFIFYPWSKIIPIAQKNQQNLLFNQGSYFFLHPFICLFIFIFFAPIHLFFYLFNNHMINILAFATMSKI